MKKRTAKLSKVSRIETQIEFRDLLESVMHDVLSGRITPEVANGALAIAREMMAIPVPPPADPAP